MAMALHPEATFVGSALSAAMEMLPPATPLPQLGSSVMTPPLAE
ncbi:hypothetical protein LMG29542_08505 [Paraburkholderia humisilvae]|uniref:Uncharacterized protein n=1 Tax=Paraburkholderia humisilvae TaxID=627669 RepID=A0A6J5F9S1_9BURK|nr:hypothetical protein LMG29542_08505 [Paraburkholderia humisilvae]